MDNIFSEMRKSDEEMAAAKEKQMIKSRTVDHIIDKYKKESKTKQNIHKLSINDIEEI